MAGVPSKRYLAARGLIKAAPKSTPRRPLSALREVYFVQGEQLGLIKIGLAEDAKARLVSLQVGSPDRLRLLGVIQSYEALALEARLHGRFWAHHSHGEWFRPAPELLAFIATDVARAPDLLAAEVRAGLELVAGA